MNDNFKVRTRRTGTRRLVLGSAFCILASVFLPGCDQAGAIGGLVARAIPRHIDASYKGLANQSVIVMVWMDRSMRADHPELQFDIAAGLKSKLMDVEANLKPVLLKGTEFPVSAEEVIQYQQDHPEIEFEPITATAAKFKGTRLIYVEIKQFDTHSGAPDLFRGSMTGDLKVVEMTADGKAKVAWHEEDLSVVANKDDPKDGVPIGTETTVTAKTVDVFTTEAAKRFYPHDEDRD